MRRSTSGDDKQVNGSTPRIMEGSLCAVSECHIFTQCQHRLGNEHVLNVHSCRVNLFASFQNQMPSSFFPSFPFSYLIIKSEMALQTASTLLGQLCHTTCGLNENHLPIKTRRGTSLRRPHDNPHGSRNLATCKLIIPVIKCSRINKRVQSLLMCGNLDQKRELTVHSTSSITVNETIGRIGHDVNHQIRSNLSR